MSIDFRNTRFWVSVLLTLLVVLNAVAFGVYVAAHPDESFAEQLWSYAESDVAKLIAASLILPLLIFVVEGRFNVTETVRASRVERARKAQDERRDARLETISQTSLAWNELFGLATTISSPQDDLNFTEVRAKLWNAPVLFEDIINRWRVRFPNLSTEDALVSSYTFLVGTLIECAASALFHIREAAGDEERSDIRGSIDLIAGGVDRALHHSVPNILNASLELMEIRESQGVEELRTAESDEQVAQLVLAHEAEIALNVTSMNDWAEFVRSQTSTRQILATVDGDEVREFRALFQELATVAREDPSVAVADDERAGTLAELYERIPRAQRLHAWNVKYSRDWLAELADQLVFQDFIAELSDPMVTPSS